MLINDIFTKDLIQTSVSQCMSGFNGQCKVAFIFKTGFSSAHESTSRPCCTLPTTTTEETKLLFYLLRNCTSTSSIYTNNINKREELFYLFLSFLVLIMYYYFKNTFNIETTLLFFMQMPATFYPEKVFPSDIHKCLIYLLSWYFEI